MSELQDKLLTGIVTYLFGIATMMTKDYFEPKAKVVWWNLPKPMLFEVPVQNQGTSLINVPQNQSITLPQTFFNIFTSSIFIQNIGKKTASEIEICHKRRPEHFKLYPSRAYSEEFTPDGAHIIRVTSLGYAELVIVEYLAFTVAPELNYIRANNRPCEKVDCYYQRKVKPWLLRLILLFMLIGIATVITFLVLFTINLVPHSWLSILSKLGINK